jgi:gas vesicle protein
VARYDEDVTVIETDSAGVVKWFLLGALVGAGLGLLFAPQSGERTRKQIARKAKALRNEAEDRWDDLVDDVETKGRALKEKAESLVEDVREEFAEGKREARQAARSARDELEKRLEAARARRRAAVGADGVADDDDDETA